MPHGLGLGLEPRAEPEKTPGHGRHRHRKPRLDEVLQEEAGEFTG